MKFLKSKFGGIISVLIVLIMSATLFTMFTGQTNNGARSFSNPMKYNESYSDSVGNMDSLAYPYYMNGGKYEDWTLIQNQTINYEFRYVSAGTTSDTLWAIVFTKSEGINTLEMQSDTVTIVGSSSTGTPTAGSFSFTRGTDGAAKPGGLFKIQLKMKQTGTNTTKHRNNSYLLGNIWAPATNTVPTWQEKGNH